MRSAPSRRCLSLLLGLVMVASLVVPAAAAPPPWAGPPAHAAAAIKAVMKAPFVDMDEAPWALPYVAKTAAMGLFTGRGGGQMAPMASVSVAELLTLGARVATVDADELAGEMAGDPLPFANAASVPAWARGYVALALELDLFDAGHTIQANRAVSRMMAIEVVIRALLHRGVLTAAELDAARGQQLEFYDLASLNADEMAYLFIAVDRGIIRGYGGPAPTIRPYAALNRAEMAAILSRVIDGLEPGQDIGKPPETMAVGTLVGLDLSEGTITILREAVDDDPEETEDVPDGNGDDGEVEGEEENGNGGPALVETTFYLAEEVTLTLNNVPAELTDLREGDKVRLLLDEDGHVDTILATFEEQVVVGTVVEVVAADDGSPELITVLVEEDDPEEITYSSFASYLRVRLRGSDAPFSDILPTDLVEVNLHSEQVFFIVVVERSEYEVVGTITAVDHPSEDQVGHITLATEGDETYSMLITNEVEVFYEGEAVPVDLLEVGDVVEVKVEAGLVRTIVIDSRADEEETGDDPGDHQGENGDEDEEEEEDDEDDEGDNDDEEQGNGEGN